MAEPTPQAPRIRPAGPWRDDSPDSRLRALVRLLARQAADSHFRTILVAGGRETPDRR
jgi:hypothetical protein